MMDSSFLFLAGADAGFAQDLALLAGMASPLPSDYDFSGSLTELAHARLQSISFFLAAFLVSTLAVQGLWNYLAKDIARMPRLSFGRALSLVLLCGMLFAIVLTMISGARELLTPGAWKQDGWTYQLQNSEEAR